MIIKPKIENKFKTCFIFYAAVYGREEYEIKPVLFLSVLGLLAATKTLFKRNEKEHYLVLFSKPKLKIRRHNMIYYQVKNYA